MESSTVHGDYDVIIIGGGPAGLSAALLLGRCRRSVLVIDNGNPRNIVSKHIHAFLSRDGISPRDFFNTCHEEILKYPSVTQIFGVARSLKYVCDGDIIDIKDYCAGMSKGITHVLVVLTNDVTYRAKNVLIATGMQDELPEIPGFHELYGKCIYHCPYCDGWENQNKPLAMYGNGSKSSAMALELTIWSKDVVLCTEGPADVPDHHREALARCGIPIIEGKLVQIEGNEMEITKLVFDTGQVLTRPKVLFFNTSKFQHSSLPEFTGCESTPKGIKCGFHGMTERPRVFLAGNITHETLHFVVTAASQGLKAGCQINSCLLEEQLGVSL
jgi:thioredoxin reductase